MDAKARKRARRRLRGRLSSARFWTVVSGASVAGSAYFVPFDGMTGSDGVWIVVAGFSTALAVLRWLDYRRLSRLMPAERDSSNCTARPSSATRSAASSARPPGPCGASASASSSAAAPPGVPTSASSAPA
ncbi:hypothetical protein GCM10029992_61700 [Glycomyces albus]